MIEAWKETILENPGFYVGWLGLALGIIFGFVVYRSNFCTMGSISDIVSFGDYRRFRTWILAAAVAMVGAWFLQLYEIADLSRSIYLTPNFNWIAYIAGGLLFGFGMVFAGGCVTKNLVRAGAGDIRSLIVLIVVGLFAYMTIGGIIGLVRANVFDPLAMDLAEYSMENQSIGSFLSSLTGIDADTANQWAMIAIAIAIAAYCFKDKDFRTSSSHVIAGIIIGLCVIGGWMLTGLAYDEFADTVVPATSITFVRPTGDTLEYLMRFTAFGAPSFAVVTLLGTMIGATIASVSMGRFRFATFADVKDTRRNLFGAALMGIGGVLALGCTVGQALTGFSTMALGSMITFAAIVSGGFLGINVLNRILMNED